MKPIVADGGVLALFCDPDNERHASVAKAVVDHLMAGHQLIVPVSAWCELLAVARRITPHATATVNRMITSLAGEIHNLDQHAARLAARHLADHTDLNLGQALVLGTAHAVDAAHVFTTEPTLAHVDPRVHVLG